MSSVPVVVSIPEVVEVQRSGALARAEAIEQCSDDLTVSLIASVRRDLKLGSQVVFDALEPSRKRADETKQEILALRAKLRDPLDAQDRRLGALASAYLTKVEQARAAEEARQTSIRQAEEQARRKQEVADLKAAGLKEEAKQLKSEPVIVAPAILPRQVVEKAPSRKVWKWRLKDRTLIPHTWLLVDEKGIDKFVRERGASAALLIPGIEVYSEEIQTIRK